MVFATTKRLFFAAVLLPAGTAAARTPRCAADDARRPWGGYKDVLANSSYVCALTDSGVVVVWDLHTLDTLATFRPAAGKRFYSIGQDRQGTLYFGGRDIGVVFQLDRSGRTLTPVARSPYYPIVHIVFSSDHTLFLVVPYALYNPKTGQHWEAFFNVKGSRIAAVKRAWGLPNPFNKERKFKRWVGIGRYEYETMRYFEIPKRVVVTTNDVLVMTRNGGEWYGHYYFFDLKKQRMLEPTPTDSLLRRYNPYALCADDRGNAFVAANRSFDNTPVSGIFKITANRTVVSYPSPIVLPPPDTAGGKKPLMDWNNPYNVSWPELAFNPYDQCLYHTVYDCASKTDSIVRHRLDGDTGLGIPQPAVSGIESGVLKILFPTAAALLFLTTKNSIGIWDGVRLRYLH